MKRKTLYKATIILFLFIFGCGNQDNTEMKEHNHELKPADSEKSEIIREGIIDVESLDMNEDGKIFECPMDWNVLDDKGGSCPTCGMHLKEYTLDEIKSNLTKYGYEYKK